MNFKNEDRRILPNAEANLSRTELRSANGRVSQRSKLFNHCRPERMGPKYSQPELELLVKFLRAWSLGEPDDEQRFRALNSKSRELACLYFRAMYRTQNEKSHPQSFEEFYEEFSGKVATKRKEMKFKIIYKNVLKALEKMFRYTLNNFMLQHHQPRFRPFLRHAKNAFYLSLFRETILKGRVHEDLLMDILHERVTVKKPTIDRDNNWRSMPKPVTMRKVSAAMRYLIRQDDTARRRVLAFMDYSGSRGLVLMMRSEIVNKLESKQRFWEKMLKKCNNRFDEFKHILVQLMNSKSFKNPWTMADVKAAIDHCVSELENPVNTKLRSEFIKIRNQHYSQ